MTDQFKPQEPNGAASAMESPATFESALVRLESLVRELEDGRIGLAEALARYEEGVGLLKQCFGQLETAERRIELLTGVDAAGNPVVQPFDDTASTERAELGAPPSRSRTAAAKPADGPAAAAKRTGPKSSSASAVGGDSAGSDGPEGGPTKMDAPKGLF